MSRLSFLISAVDEKFFKIESNIMQVSNIEKIYMCYKLHCVMLQVWVTLANHKISQVFIRGQFWPSGIVVACVRVSVCLTVDVCLCVNHLIVHGITHDLFKRGSPNLDQRCNRPWLRSLLFCEVIDQRCKILRLISLLFWEAIDLDLQGKI